MKLLIKDFDYNLPLELIAQAPVKPRDNSRLLLLNKKSGEIKHYHFHNIVDFLNPGDLLVLNNSKVFPARLIGQKKDTKGKIEVFLHRKINLNTWECLLRGRIKENLIIIFQNKLFAQVIKNNNDGTWQVKFSLSGKKFWQIINKIGEVPLPPYIKRSKQILSDKNNYQTVFAAVSKIGSVAAPTAGLHFTTRLLKKIRAKGVKIVYVTLHVGLGTFAPVKVENILDHKMHCEYAEANFSTIKAILDTKKNGGRVIPVGTTSCRVLESINWDKFEKDNLKKTQNFWTDIFIYPGYKFKITDALITNFHLPKSTLLMLISALAGKRMIKSAYQVAIKENYRFFSYGDSMFIY